MRAPKRGWTRLDGDRHGHLSRVLAIGRRVLPGDAPAAPSKIACRRRQSLVTSAAWPGNHACIHSSRSKKASGGAPTRRMAPRRTRPLALMKLTSCRMRPGAAKPAVTGQSARWRAATPAPRAGRRRARGERRRREARPAPACSVMPEKIVSSTIASDPSPVDARRAARPRARRRGRPARSGPGRPPRASPRRGGSTGTSRSRACSWRATRSPARADPDGRRERRVAAARDQRRRSARAG